MKTKRIFSLLFAACMCVMLFPTTAFAAGAPHLTTGGTPTFSADEGYGADDVSEQYVTIYVNDDGLAATNLEVSYTKWVCKDHIVFTPKYSRKIIYNQLRKDICQLFKNLCKWKGVEIIVGHMMPDYVHLLVSIVPKYRVT